MRQPSGTSVTCAVGCSACSRLRHRITSSHEPSSRWESHADSRPENARPSAVITALRSARRACWWPSRTVNASSSISGSLLPVSSLLQHGDDFGGARRRPGAWRSVEFDRLHSERSARGAERRPTARGYADAGWRFGDFSSLGYNLPSSAKKSMYRSMRTNPALAGGELAVRCMLRAPVDRCRARSTGAWATT